MSEAYYDTGFLFKVQAPEADSAPVRTHAMTVDGLVCCIHGRAEFAAICHRKFREGAASQAQVKALLAQLETGTAGGGIRWLPVSDAIIERVEEV